MINLLKTIAAVLILLLLFSCGKQDEVPLAQEFSYLALGDSYTIGQGVDESLSWPNQLSDRLRAENVEVLEPTIIAQTAWKTSDLIHAVEEANLEKYDLVSLLIGVNNQFVGQSFELFNVEFDSLLNKSIELAGSQERVFVLSIPDYGVTPFGSNNSELIAQEIDMYNEYIKGRCLDQSVAFIDITSISRQLGASQGALASDNLHPSGSQYAMWVEMALPRVKALLLE